MSNTYQSLSHSRWDCKYHVVFVPKRRRKTLFWAHSSRTRRDFSRVGAPKGMPDHRRTCHAGSRAHVYCDTAQASVASVIGFLKGKSPIAIARQFGGRERNFSGEHFWARGYAVSTVGFELEQVRAYIRDQEATDEQGLF
jgi:putative transposase